MKSNILLNIFIVFLIIFSCDNKNANNNVSVLKRESGLNFTDHSKKPKNKLIRSLNTERFKLNEEIKEKYNQDLYKLHIKGTMGGAILNEIVWTLNLLEKGTIPVNESEKVFQSLMVISKKLKKIKTTNKNLIWQVDLNDLDERLLPKSTNNSKQLRWGILINRLKKRFPSEKEKNLILELETNINEIHKLKKAKPDKVNFLEKTIYSIKAESMMFLIFERGLLSPNWFFWFLNDLLIKDKSGIEAYIEGREKYGQPIASVSFGGKTTYVVVDNNFARQIYDQSPKVFGPGQVKWRVFRTFMPKNIGITADYNDWHNRRKLNEEVLFFKNDPHIYAQKFNDRIARELNKKSAPKNPEQFFDLAKRIVCSIVFNDPKDIPTFVFDMFKEANTIKSILSEKHNIQRKLLEECHNFFLKHIINPKEGSLIELAKKAKSLNYCCPYMNSKNTCPIKNKVCNHSCIHMKHKKNKKCKKCKALNYCLECANGENQSCESELLNQIPHWIFPMMKLLYTTLPRMLLFLSKHPKVLEKVKNEINSIDINDVNQIYELKYIRKCVLETLRLNNVTVVTLRRLKKDYSFDYNNKYRYSQGTEFVILSNPILREAEKYDKPNQFIPERWDEKGLEDSYYAVMFNQGPQICPGKNLALMISQAFIAHYLKSINFDLKSPNKLDTNYIEQMINPLKIKFN